MSIFDSQATLPVSDRTTESAHRKIELQSPADLTYVVAKVSRAAREKLDRHLPPDAITSKDGGEDEMRRRVGEHLDRYIRDTFAAAKDSMCINGMDSEEMEAELAKAQEGEEIEPFDGKLALRIQNLSAQIEARTLELAQLRRTAPTEASNRFRERFDRMTSESDAKLERDAEEQLRLAKEVDVNVGEAPRLEEVKVAWQQGTEGLVALRSGMGNSIARMERAKDSVDVVQQGS